eukprot:GSChrysophyteH1.ASY1.ANO1.3193.1 assembled CDS
MFLRALFVYASLRLLLATSLDDTEATLRAASWGKHGDLNISIPELSLPEWGSYRPGVYFGLKQLGGVSIEHPHSAVTGLLWGSSRRASLGMRHDTEQDQLRSFEWIEHDGRSYGVQRLQDDELALHLETSFVSFESGGSDSNTNVIIYLGLQFELIAHARPVSGAEGESFRDCLADPNSIMDDEDEENHSDSGTAQTGCYLSASYAGFSTDTAVAVKKLQSEFQNTWSGTPDNRGGGQGRRARTRAAPIFRDEGDLNNQLANESDDGDTVTLALQFLVPIGRSTDIDVSLKKKSGTQGAAADKVADIKESNGSSLTAILQDRSKSFHKKFDERFHFSVKENFTEADKAAAKIALSSTLGGIGYYYGIPRTGDASAASEDSKSRVVPEPIRLLTATPSRTAFPRGFLWDEGFHQQLLLNWDPLLAMNVLKHWLEAQYHCDGHPELGGWMPRELILGDEALARVPEEFVTQRVDVANPPALLLVIQSLLRLSRENGEYAESVNSFLNQVYEPLHHWIRWLALSQRGSAPGSFRWRGRSKNDGKILPNTLASGLDDYPRSAFPDEHERHVDLHCWVTFASKIMTELEVIAKLPKEKRGTLPIAQNKGNSSYIDEMELHWADKYGFADFGLAVIFKMRKKKWTPTVSAPKVIPSSCSSSVMEMANIRPKISINRVGYVNLFPLLLRVISADDEDGHLTAILDVLENPQHLWTDFGLRSISASDLFYNRGNSPGDAPYWRGPIWIPINYLAISALHHYGAVEGPCQLRAIELYKRLRHAVVRNVLNEYHRTGFFWEHYEDTDGHGSRGHPFTGWTALFVALMSEKY